VFICRVFICPCVYLSRVYLSVCLSVVCLSVRVQVSRDHVSCAQMLAHQSDPDFGYNIISQWSSLPASVDYTKWLPRVEISNGCQKVFRTASSNIMKNKMATMRTNAATKEEKTQWRPEFEIRTKTKWIVRKIYPNLVRLAYRTTM
jgi:hypothetical protein